MGLVKILHHLTGGRPMKLVAFGTRNFQNGKTIDYYQDKLGRGWLAESSWAIKRYPVEMSITEVKETDDLFGGSNW